MEDFFGGSETQEAPSAAKEENANVNPYMEENTNTGQSNGIEDESGMSAKKSEENKEEEVDVFAGVDMPTDGAQDITTNEEPTEEEPTFLSVWQEQRRKTLEERAQKEREMQKELQEKASADLKKFHSDRAKRIDAMKEQNRNKEKTLKEDINSVFEHGTIWEQVSRMVNLNESTGKQTTSITADQERMRNLLIHLKNERGK